MLTLGIAQASLALLSLNRIFDHWLRLKCSRSAELNRIFDHLKLIFEN